MSPNEMMVLRLALELKRINKVTLAEKMAISTDYADWLIKGLYNRNYLDIVSNGRYPVFTFSEAGREHLLADLFQMKGTLEKKMEWLGWQRNKVLEKIAELSAMPAR